MSLNEKQKNLTHSFYAYKIANYVTRLRHNPKSGWADMALARIATV
jgi:hypothetical protein